MINKTFSPAATPGTTYFASPQQQAIVDALTALRDALIKQQALDPANSNLADAITALGLAITFRCNITLGFDFSKI